MKGNAPTLARGVLVMAAILGVTAPAREFLGALR
jgi:hypothetical protein